MNRERVLAEVPPAVAAWLAQHAGPDTWERLARDVATAVGRRLLANAGEAAWNTVVFELLLADPSPAVAWSAAALGTDGRWARGTVAVALVEWFGLHGAWRELRDRLP